MASDVARLRVVVTADTTRGIAGLTRTNAAVNRLGRSSEGTGGRFRRMTDNINNSHAPISRVGRNASDAGTRFSRLGRNADGSSRSIFRFGRSASDAGTRSSRMGRNVDSGSSSVSRFGRWSADAAGRVRNLGRSTDGSNRSIFRFGRSTSDAGNRSARLGRNVDSGSTAISRFGRWSSNAAGRVRHFGRNTETTHQTVRRFGRGAEDAGGRFRNMGRNVDRSGRSARRSNGSFIRFLFNLIHMGGEAAKGLASVAGASSAVTQVAGVMGSAATVVTLLAIALGLVGALGAPLAGLLGATLPVAFTALAVAAAATNKKVLASFKALGPKLIGTVRKAVAPIVPIVLDVVDKVAKKFDKMRVLMQRVFKAVGPMIEPLVDGMFKFGNNLLSGVLGPLEKAQPIMQQFGTFLGDLGAGIGIFFKQLFNSNKRIQGMVDAIDVLGQVFMLLMKYIGEFFGLLVQNTTNLDNFKLLAVLCGEALLLLALAANELAPYFGILLKGFILFIKAMQIMVIGGIESWKFFVASIKFGIQISIGMWKLMMLMWNATWNLTKTLVIQPMIWFFTKGIPAAAGAMWRLTVAAWNLLWNGLKVVGGWIYNNVIAPMVRWFRTNIPAAARALANWVVAAWNTMWNGLKTIGSWIYNNIIAPMVRWFRTAIPAAARALSNWVVAAWNTMWNGIKAVGNWIYNNVIAPMVRWFRTAIPAAARALANWVVAAWKTMWNGLKMIGSWIYSNVIRPMVNFFRNSIPAAARFLARGVRNAWNTMGRWISSAFSWMRSNVFAPIGRFFTQTIPRWAGMMARGVKRGWDLMTGWVRGAYRWVSRNVFSPIGRFFVQTIPRWARTMARYVKQGWDMMTGWIRGAYRWVNRNVFDPIWRFFVQTIPRWSRTMARYVKQGWDMMTGWVRGAYRWVNRNVFDPIYSFFVKKIPAWSRTMARYVKQGWDKMTGWIRSAYRWVVSNVFNPLKNFFVKTIPSWARTCATWVGKAWNKLKGLFKAPVKWVIDVVYNKALVPLWNNTAAKIPGIGKMKKWNPKGFATGGYTGSGAKHQPKGIVHGGEYVIKKSSTNKIPRPVLDHMNRTGKLPGYADGGKVDGKDKKGRQELGEGGGTKKNDDGGGGGIFGGIVDFVKKIGKGIKNLAGDAWGWATGMLRDGAADAFVALWNGTVGPAKKAMSGLLGAGGKGEWAEGFKSVPDFWRDMIADFIRSKEMPLAIGYSPAPAWKDGDGERTHFRGGLMNVRTMKMLKHAEKIYKHAFSVTQGSFSTGVGASAGTHDGGGVVDLAQTDDRAIGALRASGFAAWARSRKEGFSPHTHAVAVGDHQLSGAAKAQVKAFFQGKNGLADNGPDTYMGGVGGTANRWKSVALQALRLAHEPASKVNNVIKAMAKESGGNPRAINDWDSNAKRGTPSKGLMQVIQPTFNQYAGKLKGRGIYDPLANIYAAIMYAKDRYGGGWDARMARPGGYANGTNNARKGWSWVGERGPELVNFGGGEKVLTNSQSMNAVGGGDTINITIEGNVLTTKRELENLILTALSEAKRKGRKV